MLLNEQEVVQFPLNKRAVEDYSAQVINTLNQVTDAAERYAIARCLKTIVDTACENCGAAGEAFLEETGIGWEGKEFDLCDSITDNPAHKGVKLIRQFIMDYNYADNATDEEGDPIPYREAVRAVEKTKKILEAQKATVKAYETIIKECHPNMKPEVIRVTLKLNKIPD